MSAGVALPVGRTDLAMLGAAGSSHRCLLSLFSSQRFTTELEAVSVVDDAIENGVGQGWIADQVMPAIDRNLAGDQRRAAAVAVLDDLEQIVPLIGAERFSPQSSRISSFTPPSARISRA